MKKLVQFLIPFFAFLSLSLGVFGQVSKSDKRSECNKMLEEAVKLFESGFYKEADNLLNQLYSECSLSNSAKQYAAELRIRIFLETDRVIEADSAFKRLLRKYPNYVPNDSRMEENYLRAFSHYVVTPKLILGAYSEYIQPKYEFTGPINRINPAMDYSAGMNKKGLSFGLGAYLEYNLFNNFRATAFLGFQNFDSKRKISYYQKPDFFTEYSERLVYLETGIDLRKYFEGKRFSFFIGLGYKYKVLANCQANLSSVLPVMTTVSGNTPQLVTTETPNYVDFDIQMTDYRRKWLFYYYPTVGVNFNLTKRASFGFCYSYQMTKSDINSGQLNLDPEILMRTYYIDSNYKNSLHSFKISFHLVFGNRVINKNPLK